MHWYFGLQRKKRRRGEKLAKVADTHVFESIWRVGKVNIWSSIGLMIRVFMLFSSYFVLLSSSYSEILWCSTELTTGLSFQTGPTSSQMYYQQQPIGHQPQQPPSYQFPIQAASATTNMDYGHSLGWFLLVLAAEAKWIFCQLIAYVLWSIYDPVQMRALWDRSCQRRTSLNSRSIKY